MAVFGDGEGGAGRLGETPAREKKIAHFQMLFDHKSGRRQLHAGNIWDNAIFRIRRMTERAGGRGLSAVCDVRRPINTSQLNWLQLLGWRAARQVTGNKL